MVDALSPSQTYTLGHSDDEVERLDRQGILLRPHTERLLRDAGIGPGMRVLEVGCGTGDVTALLAALVGPTGQVVSVDRAPEAVITTRRRMAALKFTNLRVVEDDAATFAGDSSFDAVVGRLILMHLPDPVGALRNLARAVRPGGAIAFQEMAVFDPPVTATPRPLMSRVCRWVGQGFTMAGTTSTMGVRLYDVFVEAGLPAPQARLDGLIAHGGDRAYMATGAGVIRSLLPVLERFGIATAAEVDIDTLLDRLVTEGIAAGDSAAAIAIGGAWVAKPVD